MKYRTYPKTDISVSEVGFGLWTTSTGWWGEMTDERAVDLLHEALDLGVTLFDAADTYGNGRSEEQLGKAFEHRRSEVVYSTKFGYDFYTYAGERKGQQEIPHDFSPAFVRYALERSLQRLRTDVIDVYSIHNAHLSEIENDELFALLESFKSEGKIRSYGTALGPAIGWLVEGRESSRRRNVTNVQMIWNVFEQFPGQRDGRGGGRVGRRHRLPDPRAALERHARGPLHARDDVSAGRPSHPPAAVVAGRRRSRRSRRCASSRSPAARSARPRSSGSSRSRASSPSSRTSTTRSSCASSRPHPTRRGSRRPSSRASPSSRRRTSASRSRP